MNILIVSQYYYPEQFLINEIAPELVKKGHQVTVLTGLPNYPEGEILKEYKLGKKREENINGVKVLRCSEIGRHKSKIFLLLNYISYSFFGSLKARKLSDNYDVIFSYQLSPILQVLPAITYKKKHNTPILLYCLDIWPESAQAHVKNDKSFLYEKIAAISKSIYNKIDRIAVTSEPFIEYMNSVNEIPLESLSYIPQHADDRFLYKDLTSDNNGVVDFMFAGNLGAGQTLDVIIRAAAEIKERKDFLIHFVGDGSQQEKLKSLAVEKGVEDKIIFHGRHPFSDMDKFYKRADVLLITLRGNNFVGNTMPGKLQVYMTIGKPILGAINGAAQTIINNSNCGACVNSGDYVALSKLMVDYIENNKKYKDCGENARKYFKENFTMKIFIDKLENELKATADLRKV